MSYSEDDTEGVRDEVDNSVVLKTIGVEFDPFLKACRFGQVHHILDAYPVPLAVASHGFYKAAMSGQENAAIHLMASYDIDLSSMGPAVFHTAVLYGKVELVRRLLQDESVDTDPHEPSALLYCIQKHARLEMLECLLTHGGTDPSTGNKNVLWSAVSHNKTNAIRLLLAHPRIDPSPINDMLMRAAVGRNHIQAARLLLADPRIDPSCVENEPLRMAVSNKSPELVRMLLAHPRVDPACDNQTCLNIAIHAQCINRKIVRMLLADPRVDPSVGNQALFVECVYRDQAELLELFLAHPRIDPTANNNFAFEVAYNDGYQKVLRVMWANELIWKAHCAKPHGLPTYAFDWCWQKDLSIVIDYASVCTKLYDGLVGQCGEQPAIYILALKFSDKLAVRGGPTQFRRAVRLLTKLCAPRKSNGVSYTFI